MESNNPIVVWARAVAGVALGAVVGYFVYEWILRQGFYALVIPGAMIGWGAGFFLRTRRPEIGVLAAVVAFVVSILSEWATQPFIDDESLGYFLTHLHQLQPITWIMIALGTYIAFSWGAGRNKVLVA